MCQLGDFEYWRDEPGEEPPPPPAPVAYSVSLQPVARHVWVLRTHPRADATYGDPWVGCCVVRAERFVGDDDLAALDTDAARPVAHLFATMGQYPLSAHRVMEATLRAMGFTYRYHERIGEDGGKRLVARQLQG